MESDIKWKTLTTLLGIEKNLEAKVSFLEKSLAEDPDPKFREWKMFERAGSAAILPGVGRGLFPRRRSHDSGVEKFAYLLQVAAVVL